MTTTGAAPGRSSLSSRGRPTSGGTGTRRNADALISAVQAHENGRPRSVQLIVETHSEHLLNRLQRRIAEAAIPPADVAIYFARPGSDGAALEELQVNELGDIANWPVDFFGDEMRDVVARTEAASRRRRAGEPG